MRTRTARIVEGRQQSTASPVTPPTERWEAPDLFLWAVMIMVLTYVWRVHLIWGNPVTTVLVSLRVALGATGIALMGWYLGRDVRRRLSAITSLQVGRLVFALLAAAMLSVVAGGYQTKAFGFFRVSYLSIFLLLILSAAAIRSFRDVERLCLTYLAGALIYCGRVIAEVRVGRSGRLDNLWSYDANDLGFLIVCTLPIAVYFLRRGARSWERWLAITALPIMMVTLVRTGSRGAFLGLLAVGGYLLFRFDALSKRLRTTAVAGLFVLLIVAGNDTYWSLMETLLNPSQDYNYAGGSQRGRIETWKRGLGYMMQWPVFGVGLDNFGFAEGQSALNRERSSEGKGWVWAAPHNSFIQVGVEMGFVGLGVFVVLLWKLSLIMGRRRGRSRHRGPPGRELALGQALTGAIVGYVVAGFFLSQAYSAFLYGILGLSLGLLKVERRVFLPAQAPNTRSASARMVRSPISHPA